MLHGELGVSVSSWTPQRRTVAIGRHYTRMVPTGRRRLMCPHFLALRVLHVNHRMCCKCEVSCATSSHSQRVNNCRQGCPVMGEVVQKHPASHKGAIKAAPEHRVCFSDEGERLNLYSGTVARAFAETTRRYEKVSNLQSFLCLITSLPCISERYYNYSIHIGITAVSTTKVIHEMDVHVPSTPRTPVAAKSLRAVALHAYAAFQVSDLRYRLAISGRLRSMRKLEALNMLEPRQDITSVSMPCPGALVATGRPSSSWFPNLRSLEDFGSTEPRSSSI